MVRTAAQRGDYARRACADQAQKSLAHGVAHAAKDGNQARRFLICLAGPALTRASQILVTSAAVEETVPDVREW